MLTQILTILILATIIGSIVYGRKLIQTEKVDAVFGNPERSKGGTHWVILGSCTILLIWMYYSWDIARGFYPKSANELCQVAKVNDSLLALKYQFPIDQRELKSTAQIKNENENLKQLSSEIQNSNVSAQQKEILIGFLNKTSQLIPLLTNEDLIENEQQLQERLQAASDEGGWGIVKVDAGSGSIENTLEVPLIPSTDKGLKFHAAAEEISLISEEFFKLRNHNSQFKNQIKEIKDQIKIHRDELSDNEELESEYAKNIVKIARRIEFASIYPPNALDDLQKAVVNFDNTKNEIQGGLRLVDIFLFPAGTIVASGQSCSEQGSGRWLPKPSDTFNKFVLMS